MSFFDSPTRVFTCAILLRVILLFYGLYQDAHSPMKYTDIDYMVFTDAARYVSRGRSPYARDTYRYTPLLAWLLVPTAWTGQLWFSFGKALFAAADVVAGWLIMQVLRKHQGHGDGNGMQMPTARALRYASIWLLNPMVATISTRGSSEGLLGVLVVALLWAVKERRIIVAGALLGAGVHFKIYPFIYGPAIIWQLDDDDQDRDRGSDENGSSLFARAYRFLMPSRLLLSATALVVFAILNIWMYALYGLPFVQHTYLHHVTRIDHRHNFSPYNILLYLSSSQSARGVPGNNFESLAFIPQLTLSALLIPLVLARKDLAGSMLAQTFAFVTFNKVCTSQVRSAPERKERKKNHLCPFLTFVNLIVYAVLPRSTSSGTLSSFLSTSPTRPSSSVHSSASQPRPSGLSHRYVKIHIFMHVRHPLSPYQQ